MSRLGFILFAFCFLFAAILRPSQPTMQQEHQEEQQVSPSMPPPPPPPPRLDVSRPIRRDWAIYFYTMMDIVDQVVAASSRQHYKLPLLRCLVLSRCVSLGASPPIYIRLRLQLKGVGKSRPANHQMRTDRLARWMDR